MKKESNEIRNSESKEVLMKERYNHGKEENSKRNCSILQSKAVRLLLTFKFPNLDIYLAHAKYYKH